MACWMVQIATGSIYLTSEQHRSFSTIRARESKLPRMLICLLCIYFVRVIPIRLTVTLSGVDLLAYRCYFGHIFVMFH